MDVIIGRESGTMNPRLCVKNGNKLMFVGQAGSVPKTVSRNHCRLELSDDGRMKITNISGHNSLYVNGLECQTKSITKKDLVELGRDHYRLDLNSVVSVAEESEGPKPYNISHLRKIWDDYSKAKLDLQIRDRNLNTISAIPGVFSMLSLLLSFFIDGPFRVLFIVIALVIILFVLIIRIMSTNAPLRQKELDEHFQDDYLCPNPQCNHFLGNRSYKLVLKDGCCPWCKSKYTE